MTDQNEPGRVACEAFGGCSVWSEQSLWEKLGWARIEAACRKLGDPEREREAYERGLADGEQQALLDAKHPAWESGYNARKKDNESYEREAYERGRVDARGEGDIADVLARAEKAEARVQELERKLHDEESYGARLTAAGLQERAEKAEARVRKLEAEAQSAREHSNQSLADEFDRAEKAEARVRDLERGMDASARASREAWDRVRATEARVRALEAQLSTWVSANAELRERVAKAEHAASRLLVSEAKLAAVMPVVDFVVELSPAWSGDFEALIAKARARLAELDKPDTLGHMTAGSAYQPVPGARVVNYEPLSPEAKAALDAGLKSAKEEPSVYLGSFADPLDRPVTYRALIRALGAGGEDINGGVKRDGLVRILERGK